MKNNVLLYLAITAFMGLATTVGAQRPVGDTVSSVDTSYYYYIYNWYEADSFNWHGSKSDNIILPFFDPVYLDYHHAYTEMVESLRSTGELNSRWHKYQFGDRIMGNHLITDHPLKILGIAACAFVEATRDTFATDFSYYRYPNTRDTVLAHRLTDSLILYKPWEKGLNKLAAGPWRKETPHRYILLPHDSYPNMPDTISPLYEVMFDHPVVVEDSFVVAGTAFNNEGGYTPDSIPYQGTFTYRSVWRWNRNPTRYYTINGQLKEWQTHNSYQGLGVHWHKFRDTPWKRLDERSFSYLGRRRKAYAIFPIIDPDFDTVIEHCAPVGNVRVAASTDSTATLMWDASNNSRWEVHYGMQGVADEYWHTLEVSAPVVELTGLQPERTYKAMVRGYCDFDSAYTDWTDPINVVVHHTEGIENPGDVGRFTYLMPNPAKDVVTVISSYSLKRVVVYDMSGRAVLDEAAEGISAQLDVSHLPKGGYIVAIHTPHGIATKKLTVF